MARIIYEKLEAPNDKFISCVEGRLFSGFKFFISEDKVSRNFYYLLCNCCLRFKENIVANFPDSWYYQPLDVFVENKYSVETERGFEYIKTFINNYGISCEKKYFISNVKLIEWAVNTFKRNGIPIVLIDQFYYPRSIKYMVQEDAIHALLLYGVDTDKRFFYVCDSSFSYLKENRYHISFDDVRNASLNIGIEMSKKKNEKISNSIQVNLKKMIDFELISIKERRAFLVALNKIMTKEKNEILFRGFSIAVKYKVLPYFEKTKLVIQTMQLKNFKRYINIMMKKWEMLSVRILKFSISKKGDPELFILISEIKQMEDILYWKFYRLYMI